jgi:polyphosphate glucokinase
MATILGIDIGGSGIKANLVDEVTGELRGERHKISTPEGALPDAVAAVVGQMAAHFDYHGPVGCTFPAVVKDGHTLSAANVAKEWVGADAAHLFGEATGLPVLVVNDADAAGVAEMSFGAGRGRQGVVIMLTLGTGIGSAIFVDGTLVPNSEFGHLELAGYDPVESWAAARVRDHEGLTWEAWAARVNRLLHYLCRFMSPDLLILGGGVSRRWEKWSRYLDPPVEVVPAGLRNEAGIVGAAILAGRAFG